MEVGRLPLARRDHVGVRGAVEHPGHLRRVEPLLRGTLLFDLISGLWGGIGPDSDPFEIQTSAGSVLELPNNGALADYVDAAQMMGAFERAVERLRRFPDSSPVVSVGFHLETAARYLPRLEQAIAAMHETAAAEGIPFGATHVPFACRAALGT